MHLGLNGAEVQSSTGITVSGAKKWGWTRRTMSNVNASLEIPAGTQVLHAWMREDGAILDRILLTLDAKYVPKDLGPPETSR
jgi:hypothetical protein